MGVMVKEELCEQVVEVRRVSDDHCCSFLRECAKVDLWVCSAKWKSLVEKQSFCDELK